MDTNTNEIKLLLNNLIWMHAPDRMTLQQAEALACELLNVWECHMQNMPIDPSK